MSSRSTRAVSELALLASAAILLAASPAEAAGRRIAVIAGNNFGAPGEIELRFARTDAQRMAQVLRELGGVSGEDLFLLLDKDVDAVRKTLAFRVEK